MQLSTLARIVKGELYGSDAEFNRVNTDTRQLHPGDLFIALKGPHFDGHQFMDQAITKGAVAALVDNAISVSIPTVKVANTLTAYGDLAAYHRRQFTLPVIGLTGSCGKTTTKTMIASILQHCGRVIASHGTFNNYIGVPHTLMRLTPADQFAVIEMGTNSVGEIAYLTNLVKPTVALITNVAPVHLEGFGDEAKIASEKAAIYSGLDATGTAVINLDDKFASQWQQQNSGKRIITFGHCQRAEVRAVDVVLAEDGCALFQLLLPEGGVEVKLPIKGKHNVSNALAAAAVAVAVGADAVAIRHGLESFKLAEKRLIVKQGINGAKVIDDTYNANPLAMQAVLAILTHEPGYRILVFADMGELGGQAEFFHQQLGEQIKAADINQLFTFGKLSQITAKTVGAKAQHFTDKKELIVALKSQLTADSVVLIKGSNSMKMWEVVEGLQLIAGEI